MAGADVTSWTEFPWQDHPSDPATDRLCEADGPRLDCRIEGADLTDGTDAPNLDEIVVCAYNAERGLRLDQQLAAFTSGAGLPRPDILLVSEADRGCTRTGERNVAREYAQALGMYYVYGVEFVELPRFWGPGGGAVARPCEHGNAIISRFPLGNVRLIRHERSRSWNSPLQRRLRLGQPRLGGRVAVVADVRIGDATVRLYSVHFESGRGRRTTDERSAYRESQATELIGDARSGPPPAVIGGDMNVVEYDPDRGPGSDRTTAALAAAGFTDCHQALDPATRSTTPSGKVLDVIAGRGVTVVDAGVGDRSTWADLSDHLPVWARFRLGP